LSPNKTAQKRRNKIYHIHLYPVRGICIFIKFEDGISATQKRHTMPFPKKVILYFHAFYAVLFGNFMISHIFLFVKYFFGIFIKVKTAPSRKTRPYTSKSKVAPTRSSYQLLRTGTLAAHWGDRLMLLGPPPDMVHNSQLRKTHSSTQQIRLNS